MSIKKAPMQLDAKGLALKAVFDRDAALASVRERLAAHKSALADRDAAVLQALALGMKQVEVAEEAGLTRLTVSRIRTRHTTR
jgi:DNA-binding NarL/FixJ family response regulator